MSTLLAITGVCSVVVTLYSTDRHFLSYCYLLYNYYHFHLYQHSLHLCDNFVYLPDIIESLSLYQDLPNALTINMSWIFDMHDLTGVFFFKFSFLSARLFKVFPSAVPSSL